MKEMNMKSFLIVAIFLTSVFAMPMAATGYEKSVDDRLELSQVDVGIFEGFQGGFGALFGKNMGYGGEILGSIFQTLFLQGLNLSSREKLDNVFVLSANQTEYHKGTYYFPDENETFFAPEQYNELINNETGVDNGFAYCEIQRDGGFNYTLEIGAGITLIIWDHDRSFINAVLKLINFFNELMTYEDELGDGIPKEIIEEGITLITWFLIHINDIFTGDELFVLNPITWQKLDIDPLPSYNVIKTWKLAGSDYVIDGSDVILSNTDAITYWRFEANKTKDSYMQWLLSPISVNDIAPTVWTQFSFDLIQLWVKNFEIHIDVAEILDAATNGEGDGSAERAIVNAFGGCDIEFYLFTHHLAGAFLYNDLDGDNRLSANYVDLVNKTTDQPILDPQGDPIQVPFDNELTHRLILGTVGKFKFEEPKINPNDKSISWGLTIEDVNISAVPIGVDLNTYLNASVENLDSIHFGFTFEPQIDKEFNAGKGVVKVVHKFEPWKGVTAPGSPIDGLDLAILYVSSVLHFHLNIATQGEIPDAPDELLKHDHYSNTTNEITIGNYIGHKAQEELDFVDIAGPEYLYGNDESSTKSANATTNILPLIVWEWEMNRHDNVYTEEGTADTFASNISVSIEFDVLLYAVCYPEFNGTGVGIWHDPTFSVYLIFESKEFWALVVLIAGVGLVGVATILIKRRKDMRV